MEVRKKMFLQMNPKILKIHKDKTCAFFRTIAVLCIGLHGVNFRKPKRELSFQTGGAPSCSGEVTAHINSFTDFFFSSCFKNEGRIKARNTSEVSNN